MKHRVSKVKPSKKKFVILLIIGLLLIVSLIFALNIYRKVFGNNIQLVNETEHFIYIPDHSTLDELFVLLQRENILIDDAWFKKVAVLRGLATSIKPGRYRILPNLSNYQLCNMIRSGQQAPVMLTFQNIRTINDLAGIVSKKITVDSSKLVSYLNDETVLRKFNLSKDTRMVLFIPNTYEFYWNTNEKGFVDRMKKEYDTFWKTARKEKADSINLTPIQVSVLASIIDEETIKEDEKPIVAGLYLNRLKMGILLQADPTVRFALGNFAINRVLKRDLEINSAYNTYKYAGLPPGPIRIPSISGIDAVLNAQKHNYIFMCAKEDFSGYHNFSITLRQHNANAAKYQRELRKMRIYR